MSFTYLPLIPYQRLFKFVLGEIFAVFTLAWISIISFSQKGLQMRLKHGEKEKKGKKHETTHDKHSIFQAAKNDLKNFNAFYNFKQNKTI